MEQPNSNGAPSLSRLLQWGALFIGVVLIGYYLRSLLIPLVFAFFLSMLILPLCHRMERIGIGRLLSSLLAVILLTSVFAGLITYLGFQVQSIMEELPDLRMKLLESYRGAVEWIEGRLGRDLGSLISLGSGSGLIRSGGALFSGAVSFTSSVLSFFGILPIYVFLILFYRGSFKRFFEHFESVSTRKEDGKRDSTLERIKSLSQGYLVGLLLVIAIIALLNTLGLLLLGIELAIPLGILSAILTVIPYIGVVIGAAMPILVAYLTTDSLWYPLGVIAIFSFVQFLEGNFITPRIIGSKVDINPLAAIVGLIGGGMLWGIAGMIMAIPMLGILKLLCEEVPDLRPFAILLNNERY